jgi:hypothetical protein
MKKPKASTLGMKKKRMHKPCVLERIHLKCKLSRKWIPQIMDHLIVILVYIILTILAIWHLVHVFPSPQQLGSGSFVAAFLN